MSAAAWLLKALVMVVFIAMAYYFVTRVVLNPSAPKPNNKPAHSRYFLFHHSYGGTDCADRLTNLSSPPVLPSPTLQAVSPGAYFRYHQHQLSLTSE